MFRVQRLGLSLCLTLFVRIQCLNGSKNTTTGKAAIDLTSYHCTDEWMENGLNYNHSIFVRNKPHAIALDWAKIFPDVCTSKVNHSEVSYYKKQLDRLLEQGIEPVAVLYSENLPAVFGPLGGWTNPIIIQYYANYARQSFKIFGNRVKTWVTFNEPRTICDTFQGLIGDEFPSGVAEYQCAHNILRAHAEAYHIYDKQFRNIQHGKISIILDMVWPEPSDSSNPKHISAAERKIHFEFGLYANPILNFDYPPIVTSRIARRSKAEGFSQSRLPEFTYAEKLRISGSYDYIEVKQKGMIFSLPSDKQTPTSTKVDCDCKTTNTFYVSGKKKWTKRQACDRMIRWIKTTYCSPEIVLTTETESDESDSGKRNRKAIRKEYIKKMLKGVLELNKFLKN